MVTETKRAANDADATVNIRRRRSGRRNRVIFPGRKFIVIGLSAADSTARFLESAEREQIGVARGSAIMHGSASIREHRLGFAILFQTGESKAGQTGLP